MCVFYIAENREDLQINYCIENLIYDMPKEEVHANLSLFITNKSQEYKALRMLHLKTVEQVRLLDLKNPTDHEFLEKLCEIYGRRLSFNLMGKTVEFYCKPRDVAGERDLLKACLGLKGLELKGLKNLELKIEYSPKDDIPEIRESGIPYTSITISHFPPRETVFYSLNMVAKKNNFDHIIGGLESPSINGTTRQLTNKYEGWKTRLGIPESRILTPLRHDLLIENIYAEHPRCFRLSANIYEERIDDKKLASKVAWFSSPDPQRDFSIEVFFPEEKTTSVARHV